MVIGRGAPRGAGQAVAPRRSLTHRLLTGIKGGLAGLLMAAQPRGNKGGFYTYRFRPPGGSRRIHLRLGANGCGLLVVDATDAIHLNPTAAFLVWSALEDVPLKQAFGALRRRFSGAKTSRETEARRVYDLVRHLATTTDRCPTCGLADLGRIRPFSVPVASPYKADLALTYGCNNACAHCYNEPARRPMGSLALADWRRVLDRLAALGVFQVIFTGGEPTLFDGLADLVRHAERLGLVTGLNTNGRRLADEGFTRQLVASGLSHAQITLESCRPEVHNAMTSADSFDHSVAGIRNALAAGLHTITNTTLTWENMDHAEELVDFLHRLGLRTFAANGMIHSGHGRQFGGAISEEQLGPLVVRLRDRAAELGMRFLWYTPTAWCRLSPEKLDVGPRRCNAAEYSIAVEPNGDVLPCQSYYTPAGNLLRDPWEAIWTSDLFRRFRMRVADPAGSGLPEKCWDCPDLPLCAGGCPLERQVSQAFPNPSGTSPSGK